MFTEWQAHVLPLLEEDDFMILKACLRQYFISFLYFYIVSIHTQTHTHTTYTCMCVCVCVCVYIYMGFFEK